MPLIHLASTEQEANERGTNVHRIDCNHDGSVIMWTYETHHGLCLEDRERNGYDDSDWYMTLWNEAKGETEEVCFASTRSWSYPCYGSSPDATPEVYAKANAFRRRLAIQASIGSDKARARTPSTGKRVRVVRGRKVPVGGIYVVHHTMDDQFRAPSRYSLGLLPHPQRVAMQPTRLDGSLNVAAGLVWTADTNLEVIDPEQYETPVAEIERKWAGHVWYSPRAKEVAA